MKNYTFELIIKVILNDDILGYDKDIIRITTSGKNSQNALLKVFKDLDLGTIKFIKKNTIKYDWQNDWSTAISFEIIEVKNVQVNA